MKEGGAVYDYCGPLYVGMANVGNTLAALKKLVYDERILTGVQVMHAIQTNYEDLTTVPSGPDIRKMLLDAPKYGNDDDYVDAIIHKTGHKWICNSFFGYHIDHIIRNYLILEIITNLFFECFIKFFI